MAAARLVKDDQNTKIFSVIYNPPFLICVLPDDFPSFLWSVFESNSNRTRDNETNLRGYKELPEYG